MKKVSVIRDYCLVGLMASFGCWSNPALADDPTITLKLADLLPATNFISTEAGVFFMNRVKELTHGKVDFQHFPASQLGKAGDMLRLTNSGVADIGFIAPSYIADKLPLSGVAELPGLYSTSCEGTHGFYALAHGGSLEKLEFRPNGVVPLIAFNVGAEQIALTGTKLNSIDDIKGKKLRGAGGTWDIILRQLGAVPVNFAVTDLHQALVLGTVDGTITSAMSMKPYDLTSIIKTMSRGGQFGSFASTYSMNAKKFDSLPADIQVALVQSGKEASEHFCNYVEQHEEMDFTEAGKAGVKYWTLSPDEIKLTNTLLQPVLDKWATGLDGRKLAGTQTLNEFRAAAH